MSSCGSSSRPSASTPSGPRRPSRRGLRRLRRRRPARGPRPLLLLAETCPDPAGTCATWDRLRADEEAHAGRRRRHPHAGGAGGGPRRHRHHPRRQGPRVPRRSSSPSTPATSRAGASRSRGGAPRRLRGRHPRPRQPCCSRSIHRRAIVQPYLRELVEEPDPEEHDRSATWREQEPGADLRSPHRRSGSRRSRCSSRNWCRNSRRRRRRPSSRSRRGPRLYSPDHSRGDGSGGATKCFAAVGARRQELSMSSCSSRSVTVRRWCWRTCSSQLGSTKVSM